VSVESNFALLAVTGSLGAVLLCRSGDSGLLKVGSNTDLCASLSFCELLVIVIKRLRCDAVYSGSLPPTFRRNLLPALP
jgi:hypothetical protein